MTSLESAVISGNISSQEIRVPLGFHWGDPIDRLQEAAHPGGFSITHREESGDKTILTVHGVVGTALEETLFTFKKNALVEIEYRYGEPSWKASNYSDFFDSFRRMYDTKYGSGTQLLKPAQKIDRSGIITSLTAYQWCQPSAVLELFYFSAEQADEHFFYLISLHYKAP